jgi:hypothetical protein
MIIVLLIAGCTLVLACVAIDSPVPLATRLPRWSGSRSQVSTPSSGVPEGAPPGTGLAAVRSAPQYVSMPPSPARPTASFKAQERDLIRREFCRHFGQDPPIAAGIFLRTWRGGERKGQPKIPPAVQTMLDRGLVEIRSSLLGPRAFFTEAGLQELRALLQDRRAMDPERFAHLRRELGLDHDPTQTAAD